MTEAIAIRTESLSKTFGHGENAVEAVKDPDLRVESGQVYGFLGSVPIITVQINIAKGESPRPEVTRLHLN